MSNTESPVYSQPASSCTRTLLLVALGLIAIYYALIIVHAGFLLGSAKYIGHLIGFWLVATSASWFLLLFGTLSARKRGTLVTPIRVGLGLLTLVQLGCGILLLPHELVTPLLCYPTSVNGATPLATALVFLPVVVLSFAFDRLYVSVTTEAATTENRSEDISLASFTRVGSWLGLPRNSPSSASNDTSEAYGMANDPGNPSWSSSIPVTGTNTTVMDEEKAHLLSDLELV